MAIQDPNRFSVQQGMMGQRANPQMQDPMQNQNRAGLPAGRSAQLQRWQDKSQAITGNQPQKGPMQNLPGRMPMPQGRVGQPQGQALPWQSGGPLGINQGNVFPTTQRQGGLGNLQDAWRDRGTIGPGGIAQGPQGGMQRLPSKYEDLVRQTMQQGPQGQGGFNPSGGAPWGGIENRPMTMEGPGLQNRGLDARQLTQDRFQPQGPGPQGPQGGLGAVGGKS